MRRFGLLFAVVLCSATLLFAGDPSKGKEMAGTICNSACVQPVDKLATCNTSCTDKTGDTVLVQDDGQVKKIANPDMCTKQMGKHVKVMAVPTEKERELQITQISTN